VIDSVGRSSLATIALLPPAAVRAPARPVATAAQRNDGAAPGRGVVPSDPVRPDTFLALLRAASGAEGEGQSTDDEDASAELPREQPGETDAETTSAASAAPGGNPLELTPEEEAEVRQLRAADRAVRQHEQAHATAGGPYAGPPKYEFEQGPDGRSYAVSGHVSIDVSPVAGNPGATIRKMETVIRAALAPSQPSPEDRAVAAQARQIRTQAQIEKREEQAETRREAQPGAAQPGDDETPPAERNRAIDAYTAAANGPGRRPASASALA
jgi:hypothetical protein